MGGGSSDDRVSSTQYCSLISFVQTRYVCETAAFVCSLVQKNPIVAYMSRDKWTSRGDSFK